MQHIPPQCTSLSPLAGGIKMILWRGVYVSLSSIVLAGKPVTLHRCMHREMLQAMILHMNTSVPLTTTTHSIEEAEVRGIECFGDGSGRYHNIMDRSRSAQIIDDWHSHNHRLCSLVKR